MAYKATCSWCKFHRKCQKWNGDDVCFVCFGENDRKRKHNNKYSQLQGKQRKNKKTHKNKYKVMTVLGVGKIHFKAKNTKPEKHNKHKKAKFKVRFVEIFNLI